ncbi:MAG: hypothetical protein WCH62_09255, partial [Candidatus Omnitrophota bacterium]
GEQAKEKVLKKELELRKQRVGKYQPATAYNYNEIIRRAFAHKALMIAMQYPMRDIDALRALLTDRHRIIFVENRENFKKALAKDDAGRYFADYFGGDFGHCKSAGNHLIAENLAAVIADKFIAFRNK